MASVIVFFFVADDRCDQRYSLRYSSGDGVVGDLFHHGEFDDVYDGHMVCREGAMTI
jgi:hypothetical protein